LGKASDSAGVHCVAVEEATEGLLFKQRPVGYEAH
jgi:hypothetical protein